MTEPKAADTARALGAALISPNEHDSNGEVANVVDGLFAIARAISELAAAVRGDHPLSRQDPTHW